MRLVIVSAVYGGSFVLLTNHLHEHLTRSAQIITASNKKLRGAG